MKILMILLALLMFSSCSLEKKVTVTTRGYETYRQTGMTDAQIKALRQVDVVRKDSRTVYQSK